MAWTLLVWLATRGSSRLETQEAVECRASVERLLLPFAREEADGDAFVSRSWRPQPPPLLAPFVGDGLLGLEVDEWTGATRLLLRNNVSRLLVSRVRMRVPLTPTHPLTMHSLRATGGRSGGE